jgi:CBS domain-containing protein
LPVSEVSALDQNERLHGIKIFALKRSLNSFARCAAKTQLDWQPFQGSATENSPVRVESILPLAQQRMITVRADGSLIDAARLLSETHRALLVVCNDEGAMVGVVTKTDVVRQVVQCGGVVDQARISAVMIKTVTSCRSKDLLHDVLALMKSRGFVHIPIVDANARPSGVVNARDALQALLQEVTDEELLLRAYVMGVGYQ